MTRGRHGPVGLREHAPRAAAAALFLLVALSGAALAQEPACREPAGRLVSVQGTVEVRRALTTVSAAAATRDTPVCPGDVIEVGDRSRAALLLAGAETVIRLDQNTTLQLPAEAERDRGTLDLLRGILYFLTRTPRALTVRTPFINAGVEGTEFLIRVDGGSAFLSVFEGRVAARNAVATLAVPSGRQAFGLRDGTLAIATPENVPPLYRRYVLSPRDAVQWAIHYDPLFLFFAAPGTPAQVPPALRPAYAAYARGNPAEALSLLDRIPAGARDADHWIFRAGLLLAIGPAEAAEARAAIDQALARGPAGAAEARALGAIVSLALNEKGAALDQARAAVAADPRSQPARLALSYAQQAAFDLGAALATLEATPNPDPLMLARIAELRLALGDRSGARAAAQQSALAAPDLARTQSVLGFTALADLNAPAAIWSFQNALALDASDPLPRLGLGLARIRSGSLEEGRQEIEIAAALDPNDPIIRTYLGRSYYEEHRDELAAAQFGFSKNLDPLDPTPPLFEAQRLRAANQPVQAWREIERSIELNQNRVVYRGWRLLEEDEAMRGAALASIYQDLGFEERGIQEAARSLTIDPANPAAHRFLADVYLQDPRREIARVSEFFQAQLLQPPDGHPISPSLTQTELNILRSPGPVRPGFNEFSALFDRDRIQLNGDAFAGTDSTFGDEAVVSGLFGRVGFSVGQFHYETDGFRRNADLEHDVYNAFVQLRLGDMVHLQAEVRHRESEQGDRRLLYDRDGFSRRDRRRIDQDTARIGVHVAASPNASLLGSLIYSDRTGEQFRELAPGATVDERSEEDGFDIQAQYILRGDGFNAVAGLAVGDFDVKRRENLLLPFPPFPFTIDTNFRVRQESGYAYLNVPFPERLVWTVGLGYTSFDDETADIDRFLPKLGLSWDVFDRLRLRAAYFETVKRELIVDQTLEPTQVAGFNQLFDDINGTRAKAYGVGLDARLMQDLLGGIEYVHRDLKVPVVGFAGPESDRQNENALAGYLYWAATDRIAVGFEPRFERVRTPDQDPERVENLIAPLSVRYFDPSGWFATLRGTLVNQQLRWGASRAFEDTEETFFVLDAAAGYRLPNRRGILSLEVNNILDQNFRFQDFSYIDAEPIAQPAFQPDISVLGRAQLHF